MISRQATQITVPIVGTAEIDIKSLTSEHGRLMNDLNTRLRNGWKIFSTHTISLNHTIYLVYVLTKIEFEKEELEKEDC